MKHTTSIIILIMVALYFTVLLQTVYLVIAITVITMNLPKPNIILHF